MRTKYISWAMLAGLLTGALPGGRAEEIVRWGGAASPNMAAVVRGLPADPGKIAPLWELKLGTHQYAIPTVDRGRIYLAANDLGVDRPGYKPTAGGLIQCVEQATGKLIWQLPIPRYFEGVIPPYHFDQWKCGLCSGPVVEGERMYVIGNRGEVLCLDRHGQANGNDGPFLDELQYLKLTNAANAALLPTDGDIVWKFNLIQELDVVLHDVCGSTPLLLGNYLYVCTGNGIDDRHFKVPRLTVPSLIALDKRTGRLVARDEEHLGKRLLHCNWSSPSPGLVAGRWLVFFGGGDGWLYAFEAVSSSPPGSPVATLKKAWAYDCNPPLYRTQEYSKHSKNSPQGPSEVIGTPVFHAGRVYVAIGQSPIHGAGQGCLSCVDAATGQPVWTSTLVDRTLATVAISDGLLYVPDYTGNLHCFEAATGSRLWTHDLGGKTWCASAFVADGKVYIGTEGNALWVLHAGREKQVLARTLLKSPPITPTAADGVLYIPTQKSLLAVPGKSTTGGE